MTELDTATGPSTPGVPHTCANENIGNVTNEIKKISLENPDLQKVELRIDNLGLWNRNFGCQKMDEHF
ncbi:hypothetical protein GCM10022422_06920 [Flavobacterium ginsengisoli]|uniref:Uncharacterized protein n=1 Tax=Flavobacterium ginsengisoli TaxID=871694 RepID=A0ABP7EZ06_9FLAO